MLKTLLLILAVAGLQARPLKDDVLRIQNGGWMIGAPQLVQDQIRASLTNQPRPDHEPPRHLITEVNNSLLKEHSNKMDKRTGESKAQGVAEDILEVHKAASIDLRRQGTEPSRRFLMDLNTGMLKEYVSEMSRRVSGFYNPETRYEFRQGTQNSQATLVDMKTGLTLQKLSEMERSAEPLEEFKQGTEYNVANLMELRKLQLIRNKETKAKDSQRGGEAISLEMRRQGTEPSRRFLIDSNTGMPKHQSYEMDRRVAGFYNYPSNYEFRQGTENSQATLIDIKTGQLLIPTSEMGRRVALVAENAPKLQKAAPIEFRRQGTEPSRRFLMDLNTGMLKEYVNEMDRRVSGFYNPETRYEFRQGTQNSRATLVDIRTGLTLPEVSEMKRSTEPLEEYRQGTEYNVATLMELRKNTLLKDTVTDKVGEGKEDAKDTSHEAVLLGLRRQGTEPSRRFFVDQNTGMLKEHTSEMDRRVAGFYNYPSNYQFRQGTENSQATVVDIRTGHLLNPLSVMQRTSMLVSELREVGDHPQAISVEVQNNHIEESINTNKVQRQDNQQNTETQALENNEVYRSSPMERSSILEEYRHGMEYIHANVIDRNVEPAKVKASHSDGVTACEGEAIDGKCYYFNPNLLSFSEAEASCKQISPLGHLASIPSADLHTRLVKMVTGRMRDPVLTWLGGIVKNDQYQWIDGSSWGYSDWMPGHPRQKLVQSCVEMFRIDESWWTTVDCGLKRASICSYPMTV